MTNTDKAIDQQEVPQAAKGDVMRDAVAVLRNEVDCRIEHGAESGGHLNYVRQELDKILQAAAKHYSTPLACGWQDISTAPKDGTKIWVRLHFNDDASPEQHAMYFKDSRWYYAFDGKNVNQWVRADIATHWMPLPGQHPTPLPAQDELPNEAIIAALEASLKFRKERGLDDVQPDTPGGIPAEMVRVVYRAIRPYLRPTPPQVDIKAATKAIAAVFVPDGIYNIEEGRKLELAAKACATTWGLTAGGKAPDLAALADAIQSAVNSKRISSRTEANGFQWVALDEILETIRQHAAQVTGGVNER